MTNFRRTIKKIVAVGASGLMVGMTLMGASAATVGPSNEWGFVVANTDVLAATTTQGAVTSVSAGGTSVVTEGSNSVLFDKIATHWQMGQMLKAIISTPVTDDSPNNGLPGLLADGVFIDNDNDEFDYTQKVVMGDLNLTMFEDNDYIQDEPVVGIKINNGDSVLNYTLDFTDKPTFPDLSTSSISFMGKDYYILSITNATTLNLLDSAQSALLNEGETVSLTVEGVKYEVSIEFIGASSVKLNINGVTTNSLGEAETQKVSGGAYVGIKDISVQDYAGGIKQVEFSIGSGKLKIKDGNDIELNDNSVSDLKAYLTVSSTGSTDTTLNQIVVEWKANDDLFVTPDSSITMPGFEVLTLSMNEFYTPLVETVEVKNGGNDYWQLRNFPLKDSVETINLLWTNSTHILGVGKDYNNNLKTTNNTVLVFDTDTDDYFVSTFDDGSNAESYLMRVTNIKEESDGNKSTLQYKKNGNWVDFKSDGKNTDTGTIGSIELTIDYIDDDNNIVNLSAGSNVNFHTLYSTEGLKVFLPYNDTGVGGSQGGATLDGWFNSTRDVSLPTTYTLRFSEEDKNENPAKGANITLTLGFNSASTPEVSVTATGSATAGGEGGRGAASSTEIQDTDVFRNFIYSSLATEILWEKPSGGQNSVKLNYHGGESFGKVYLSDSSSVSSEGSGATDSGYTTVTPEEVSSVSGKNLIVVGGPCINSVAADLLGVPAGSCGADSGMSEGEAMVKAFASPFATDKLAVLVAGWETADTMRAAQALVDATVTPSKAGDTVAVAAVGTDTVA